MGNLMRAAGFPRRHLANAPWLPEDERLGEKFSAVVARLGSGATWLLCGPRGTGKTQLATLIGVAAVAHHGRARYTVAAEMFVDLRRGFDEATSESALLRSYQTPHMLIIDDAHNRRHSEWEDETLMYVIDKRYQLMRDTVLVTNENEPTARLRMGASIVDRMVESGGIIELDGSSWRQQAQEQHHE